MTLISPEHRVLFDRIKQEPSDTRIVPFTVAMAREMVEAIEGLDSQHTAMQAVIAERDQLRAALAAAQERQNQLYEALLRYGKHEPPCRLRHGPTMEGRCECGLYQQLYPESAPSQERAAAALASREGGQDGG